LFFVPALVPFTETLKEHELDAVRFKPVMAIVLLPALAVMFAVQFPVRLLGVATTNPAGRVSVAETFVSVIVEFGLASVKVRDVVPFSGMVAAPKLLAMVGGRDATTIKLAVLLVAPDPLSLAEIGPVVLFSVPEEPGAFTFTEIAQFDNGPRLPADRLIDDEPATAVAVPPQPLLRAFGESTTKPAGRLSVKAIPVSDMCVLGLLRLKFNTADPFCTTVPGAKTLLIVGGAFTFKVADAELPVPPFVELTALLLLT
jgi:hypothetical protein